jgi:hypothetical protein
MQKGKITILDIQNKLLKIIKRFEFKNKKPIKFKLSNLNRSKIKRRTNLNFIELKI